MQSGPLLCAGGFGEYNGENAIKSYCVTRTETAPASEGKTADIAEDITILSCIIMMTSSPSFPVTPLKIPEVILSRISLNGF